MSTPDQKRGWIEEKSGKNKDEWMVLFRKEETRLWDGIYNNRMGRLR